MATSRELLSLLSDERVLAAVDAQLRLVMKRVRLELAAGVTRTGSARVKELLARVRQVMARINPEKDTWVRRWIKRTAEQAFVLGDRQATRELRGQLAALGQLQQAAAVNTTFTALNQTALTGVVAAMNARFLGIRNQVMAAVGSLVRETQTTLLQSQQIRQATTGGYLRGATGQQVADDIAAILLGKKLKPEVRERLQAVGFSARLFKDFEKVARETVISAGARTMSVRDYANLVARSQLREAHKVATVIRLQQNGVDHVRVSTHAQGEPDECTPFAGRVFYVGPLAQDPMGFPSLRSIVNGGPPFHPNCKHVLLPWVAAYQTEAAVAKAKEQVAAIPQSFFGADGPTVRKAVQAMGEGAAALQLEMVEV